MLDRDQHVINKTIKRLDRIQPQAKKRLILLTTLTPSKFGYSPDHLSVKIFERTITFLS